MVERIVCETGCVHPAYVVSFQGRQQFAELRLTPSARARGYVPKQEDMQQMIDRNVGRDTDPKYRVALKDIFS